MRTSLETNYATALFELIEEGKEKEYRDALRDFVSFLKENGDFYSFVAGYGIEKKDKHSLIAKTLDGYGLPYLTNFVCLLSDKHRIPKIYGIEKEFSSLVNEKLGVREGYAYSTNKLTADQLKRIAASLSKNGEEVELHNVLDPSLIGGVKVSIDGKVYDFSLRSRLENLTKSLLGGGSL